MEGVDEVELGDCVLLLEGLGSDYREGKLGVTEVEWCDFLKEVKASVERIEDILSKRDKIVAFTNEFHDTLVYSVMKQQVTKRVLTDLVGDDVDISEIYG